MIIKKDIDTFAELFDNSWSGARDVLIQVEKKNKEDEVMELLEEIFSDGEIPSETQINDFIWFELEDYITNLWEDDEDEEDGE